MGIKLVPVGDWTMAAEGSRQVEVTGLGDKRQITATFAAALDGTFLPMQILYQEKTDHSHPKYTFPDGFDIFHTPNHWANKETCLCFFENVMFL
jgi:prolyl oligopeptidase PreP (S9A serine peptidase family)